MDLQPNKKVLIGLLGVYGVTALLLGLQPIERPTWLIENITVWIIIGVLVLLYVLRIRFSTFAYCLGAILLFLHTIGGHYTFAKVPFDMVTQTFGFARNHFDRVAHFTVGFYAFMMAEWLLIRKLVQSKFVLITYPIFAIATIAVAYEWVEWIYAIDATPELAGAYLGSQGDIWDAQKDMLADTLGAITAMVLFVGVHMEKIKLLGKKK